MAQSESFLLLGESKCKPKNKKSNALLFQKGMPWAEMNACVHMLSQMGC